jgi:murein DD-endopeptidase MepM/ murein hydrolase activator NlpD
MIGNLMSKGTVRFPEIRSIVQPARGALGLVLANHRYRMMASVAGVAIVAAAVGAVGYVRYERHLAASEVAASRVEAANMDLQDELSRLRDQVAASNRDLASAQGRVVALTEEMHAHAQAERAAAPAEATPPAKGDKASAQLTQALHTAEAQRATLAARLSKAEADLAEQQAKQADLLGQIDQWQKKLEQLSSDRDRLKARVGELEKQSALRHAQQQQLAAAHPPAPVAAPAPQVAAVAPAPAAAPAPQAAPVAPAPQVAAVAPAPQIPAAAAEPQRAAGVLNTMAAASMAVPAPAPARAPVPAPAVAAVPAPAPAAAPTVAVSHGAIDQFARTLASAGVDVRHLFAEFGVNRGEGGPVVPLARGQVVADSALTPEKLAALRAMVKSLPVSAPLNSYEVSSPFGPRGDPEDGRGEFHTGIDLRAPYDSPVFATAPGVVTYAGYRDDYGKIVEIDHGNGIATRYAHLHAFTVSVGQRVGAHQQIGYLGSTGRATGPHTHYEVVVNGEPQDPEKFFALGRYVPAMTVPVSASR